MDVCNDVLFSAALLLNKEFINILMVKHGIVSEIVCNVAIFIDMFCNLFLQRSFEDAIAVPTNRSHNHSSNSGSNTIQPERFPFNSHMLAFVSWDIVHNPFCKVVEIAFRNKEWVFYAFFFHHFIFLLTLPIWLMENGCLFLEYSDFSYLLLML